MPGIPISASSSPVRRLTADPAYLSLKAHLIAATGLAYYANQDEELTRILAGRMSGLGLECLADYAARLEDEEWDALVAEMTIGETYFFRHKEMFAALAQHVLPDLIDRNGQKRALRIWSAGCANGAEPYSIAMLLFLHFRDRLDGWQVSILGTDINRSLLAEAEQGLFRSWAFRAMDAPVRKACFLPEGGGERLIEPIRRMVRFLPQNLATDPLPSPRDGLADLDLILCRNVLIYFDQIVREKVVSGLHACLGEGGWLLVGHAEPNQNLFRDFHAQVMPGAVLYRKEAAPEMAETVSFRPSASRPPAQDAAPSRRPSRVRPLVQPSERARDIRALLVARAWPEAEVACSHMLATAPFDPWGHYFSALLLERAGKPRDCEKALRRALYLERRLPLAHYRLGRLLALNGKPEGAAKSFRNLTALLKGHGDATPVPGAEPLTVRELRREAATFERALGEEVP